MLLTIHLQGYKDPKPNSPAVYGYGCKVEGFDLVCKRLAVHYEQAPGVLAANLYSGEKPQPIEVYWPEEMVKGMYADIRLRMKQ